MSAADWVVLATPPLILIIDAWLAIRRRELITDVLRKHKLIYFGGVALLSLHVLDVLGPLDPFRDVAALFDRLF